MWKGKYMKRFSLIFLLICAVFMLCSCGDSPTDPPGGDQTGSEDPNIRVDFGFTPPSNYYALVKSICYFELESSDKPRFWFRYFNCIHHTTYPRKWYVSEEI